MLPNGGSTPTRRGRRSDNLDWRPRVRIYDNYTCPNGIGAGDTKVNVASSHRPHFSALQGTSRIIRKAELMANILVNDVVTVTYGCMYDGKQLGLNRIQYFCQAAAGGALSDQQVADGLSAQAAVGYKAYLNIKARYLGVRLQKVFVGPAAPGVSSQSGNGVGAAVGDPLPTQTAMLFTKNTNVGGKVGRGRMYLPFWSEADNDADGKPNGAALAAGLALANVILKPMLVVVGASSANMVPCLAKKSTGWIPLELAATSFVQRTNWATQRRRSQINKGDQTFPPS